MIGHRSQSLALLLVLAALAATVAACGGSRDDDRGETVDDVHCHNCRAG
jgi:hypothetical protein